MALGPNPIGRRRRLGAELCDLRRQAEIDPDELARQLGWPKGKVRRLETARVRPDLGEIMDLLDALGVTGLRRDYVLELAREAAHSFGWRDAYDDPAQHDQHTLAELANSALEIWAFELTLFSACCSARNTRAPASRPARASARHRSTSRRRSVAEWSANVHSPARLHFTTRRSSTRRC